VHRQDLHRHLRGPRRELVISVIIAVLCVLAIGCLALAPETHRRSLSSPAARVPPS
jgi:hypothetical protein